MRRAAAWARSATAAAAAALMLAAVPARAANCTVDAPGLSFGQYDPFSNAPAETAATITVACDAETAFEVALGPGAGSYAARAMAGGADTMAYNLYTDPQRTIVWGDGTGGSNTVSAVSAHSDLTVYARAPARQNLTPGSYSDVISITVTY